MRALISVLLAAGCALAQPALSPFAATAAGRPLAPSDQTGGVVLAIAADGPQLATRPASREALAVLAPGERVALAATLTGLTVPARLVQALSGGPARVTLRVGAQQASADLDGTAELALDLAPGPDQAVELEIEARGAGLVRFDGLSLAGQPLVWRLPSTRALLPVSTPTPRPALARALVEWDWLLADGLGTERASRGWAEAATAAVESGARLAAELGAPAAPWRAWAAEAAALAADSPRWPELWREARWAQRALFFGQLDDLGPLAFVKHAPSMFSHQLTQYYGSCAVPGGGIFVLDRPGASWAARELTADLPTGAFQHLDVSFDGQQILFAYCETQTIPVNREQHLERVFSLWSVAPDGRGLQRLTSGPFDDFSPRWLPGGGVVFVSTRRGGYHRCGQGPCRVYTLTLLDAPGAEPRTISWHETQEWDPAVLNDGRLAYTRWDYVDRDAVFYQQLWGARPDGSNVAILYGNHTRNPTGLWEARAVPGSTRIMGTAAAHHAMTAGSVVLFDARAGYDGLEPLERLTPDVPFPESESAVDNGAGGAWGPTSPPAGPLPAAAQRWPGSTYKSPYPLSERLFIASFSYDPLIGEPNRNPPNQYGLYLVDAAGRRELLYRDPNLSSLWAMPIAPRPTPPALPSQLQPTLAAADEGTYFMQDVHRAWPPLPANTPIRALRILQVLPKTTPHANQPYVGLANASPGKQVLGTVPVEADGSAYFRAPARLPLAFQALDAEGRAVQTMRSITYLQPGEQVGCVGCHEQRTEAAPARQVAAARRAPSVIRPAPDGARPFSYPLLVQPVLDASCVSCHSGPTPDGGVDLTGRPDGHYTASYNALAPRVPYTAWGAPEGNWEPLAPPDKFGARASAFLTQLRAGHEGVVLDDEAWERLYTWADANALFYGTFEPADQLRQQAGERIAGPALE